MSIATPSQTVGPFFAFGLTTNRDLGRLVPEGSTAPLVTLHVRILDGDGVPVPDAMIEVWHADDRGEFLFGRSGTDEAGAASFETVRPVPSGGAPHINVCLFMRGLLRHVYTRVYLPGEAGLDNDPVLGLVPEGRRQTLIAHAVADAPGSYLFEVRLQGDRETVFFDL